MRGGIKKINFENINKGKSNYEKVNDTKTGNESINNKGSNNKQNGNNETFNDYKKILNIGDNHQIAFTDGGCHPNNKSKESRGGYASIFVSGIYKKTQIYGNLNIDNYNASNIRAEGMAIYQTLKLMNKCNSNWVKLTIITDCEFWIKMIEQYMPNWNKEMFEKKQNADLTRKIWMTYNELSQKGEICFIHVKSHNKDGWKDYPINSFENYCYLKNDEVDKLCNFARTSMSVGSGLIKKPKYPI